MITLTNLTLRCKVEQLPRPVAFPIRNMPKIIQYLTYLDPLRYFLEIVRGIFLKGAGFATLWPQLAILGVYGVVIMGLSALSFRKQLD